MVNRLQIPVWSAFLVAKLLNLAVGNRNVGDGGFFRLSVVSNRRFHRAPSIARDAISKRRVKYARIGYCLFGRLLKFRVRNAVFFALNDNVRFSLRVVLINDNIGVAFGYPVRHLHFKANARRRIAVFFYEVKIRLGADFLLRVLQVLLVAGCQIFNFHSVVVQAEVSFSFAVFQYFFRSGLQSYSSP